MGLCLFMIGYAHVLRIVSFCISESNYNANAYVPPRWIEDSNKTSNKDLSSSTTFRPLFLEKSKSNFKLLFHKLWESY